MNPRALAYCELCGYPHAGDCPSREQIAARAEALRAKWSPRRLEKAEGGGVEVRVESFGTMPRLRGVRGGRD